MNLILVAGLWLVKLEYDNTRRNLKPMWVILVAENTLSKIKHCPFLVNTVLPVMHRGCFNKILTDFLSFLHGFNKWINKISHFFQGGGTPYTFFKNKIFIEECILKWRNYELCLQ